MADVPRTPDSTLSYGRLPTPFGSPSAHSNASWHLISPDEADAGLPAQGSENDLAVAFENRRSRDVFATTPPNAPASPRGRSTVRPDTFHPRLSGSAERSLSTTSPLGRRAGARPGPAAMALRSLLLNASPTRPLPERTQRLLGSPLGGAARHRPATPERPGELPLLPFSSPVGLGLLWSPSHAPRGEFDLNLEQVARHQLAGAIALPCYAEGEEFHDEDGARLTLSREMKMREVDLASLRPVRVGAALDPNKTTQVLLTITHGGKFTPLKINAYNEVVDGNHRFDVAKRLGLSRCTVVLERLWPTPQQPSVHRFAGPQMGRFALESFGRVSGTSSTTGATPSATTAMSRPGMPGQP